VAGVMDQIASAIQKAADDLNQMISSAR
jgi:hypothetical protein